MKITKAIKSMNYTIDKVKKTLSLHYIRIFTDNTFSSEDISTYTKAQFKAIVEFANIMNETNEDRNKFFKLVNVIFDTRSKLNLDLRKISVKYKDATCKNSYSDMTHKTVCKALHELKLSSLFFADSQTAIKSMIKENRINETEKRVSVYALENLLTQKKQKAKSKKQVKAKSKKTFDTCLKVEKLLNVKNALAVEVAKKMTKQKNSKNALEAVKIAFSDSDFLKEYNKAKSKKQKVKS